MNTIVRCPGDAIGRRECWGDWARYWCSGGQWREEGIDECAWIVRHSRLLFGWPIPHVIAGEFFAQIVSAGMRATPCSKHSQWCPARQGGGRYAVESGDLMEVAYSHAASDALLRVVVD